MMLEQESEKKKEYNSSPRFFFLSSFLFLFFITTTEWLYTTSTCHEIERAVCQQYHRATAVLRRRHSYCRS